MTSVRDDKTKKPPFDTADLRANLTSFLNTPFFDPIAKIDRPVGNYKWGVYAFYDYDGEPIYVGQTNEMLRTRIRRHLTNQRTDAVAMSVLDPFEVYEIEVWPLPQFQNVNGKDSSAKRNLDGLENEVARKAIERSQFKAILNEKDSPPKSIDVHVPVSFRRSIVSEKVHELRSHPDFRIARRALIVSRLAQVISEREVKGGLRRVLVTQTKRLQWLASRRFEALGGALSVEASSEGDDEQA